MLITVSISQVSDTIHGSKNRKQKSQPVDTTIHSKHHYNCIPRLLTLLIDMKFWYKLRLVDPLTARHQPLEGGRVGVAVNVHQEWRWHEVRGLLRLLVQHIVIGVPHQGPVVRVEEQVIWDL